MGKTVFSCTYKRPGCNKSFNSVRPNEPVCPDCRAARTRRQVKNGKKRRKKEGLDVMNDEP